MMRFAVLGGAVWLAGMATAVAQPGPTQAELDAAGTNTRDWLYATHDYTGQRYVATDRINTSNAADLQPLCLYQMGEADTFQTNGIVYEGILYVSTPQRVAAIDATNCTERWTFEWEAPRGGGIASQRGLALKDGLLVRGTGDGFVIALNASTGEEVWRSEVSSEEAGESINMAPLIYDNLVIVGPAGTQHGWVAALELTTGEELWRFHTIPMPGDPAIETWGNQEALAAGEVGGASVWTIVSFDRENELLYVPVGNTNPAFYGGDREGDNLYTNSVVVLNIRSGEMEWYYQMEPHGVHNWDTSQAGPLFTADVAGQERDVVAATGKRGELLLHDRNSHELLYNVPITTTKDMDLPLTAEGVHVCPGYLGGVQWNGPAYNPGTGLLYVPAVDWCSVFFENPESPRGGGYRFDPIEMANGWVTAVDPSDGTVRWRYRGGAPMIAAVTTTSGNLVFTGTMGGRFVALNALNGDELYSFQTGGAMAGGIVTYEIDEQQYVAAMSGNQSGLWSSRGSPTVVLFGLPQ